MPAIFASSGLPVEEHYRRFGRPGGPMRQVSLDELLASANRQSQSIRDFEQETGVTALDRIRDFAKAASSEPTLLGTGVSAGLGGPLGGGIYAGIKDESFLTGLLALLASGAAAGGGAHLAHKGVGAALGRFAPLVRRGLDGLRKGEKLVTPGAAGWDRAMRWSRPAGSAAGAMAGTYGVSTLASQKSASDTPSTMASVAYSISRFHKIASAQAAAVAAPAAPHQGTPWLKILAALGLGAGGGVVGHRLMRPLDKALGLGGLGQLYGAVLGGGSGLAAAQPMFGSKQANLSLLRGGMQLARGAARPAARAMKNVTPRGMGGAASSFAMPSLRQSVSVTKAPGLRDYLSQAGNWAKQEWKKSPTGFAAQVGLPAYAGYKELVSDPRHMRDGARMGAEGTLNQMSDYMGNAGLMERLGFLLNPQGASNQMREMGMQQIMQALG